MNPSHHQCFQASSFLASSQESPLPGNTIPDPLCKLHIGETSEFVKSFPMSHKNRGFLEFSSRRKTRVEEEAPSTPGRPIFSFRKSNFSSKWEDAEKWVIGSHGSPASSSSKIRTSCDDVFKLRDTTEDFSEKPRTTKEKVFKVFPSYQISPSTLDHHNVPSPTDMVPQDKFTDKKGSNFRNFGDIGTEMTTPRGRSKTSRCHTPFKSSSPARHNTPANSSVPFRNIIQLRECHFAKLQLGTTKLSNWSSREEEEEEEASKSLRTQKAAWEEDENTRSCLRYRIQEAKIQAWVNFQIAKAEAQSKKLEVKIEKMRWKQEEKVRKRMEVVKRKAEEWREAARQKHMMKKPIQELKIPFSSYATSSACFSYANMLESKCGTNHT